MPKYRKKPVVIEAVQWTGELTDDMIQHIDSSRSVYHCEGALTIDTLEGRLTASPGDWIIKGVQGEFYPCKPDIFAATYELAAEPSVPPEQLLFLKEPAHA